MKLFYSSHVQQTVVLAELYGEICDLTGTRYND